MHLTSVLIMRKKWFALLIAILVNIETYLSILRYFEYLEAKMK
jgi:hypothetical protein